MRCLGDGQREKLQLAVKMQAVTPKEGLVLRYSRVAPSIHRIKSRPPGERVWLEKHTRLQPQGTRACRGSAVEGISLKERTQEQESRG